MHAQHAGLQFRHLFDHLERRLHVGLLLVEAFHGARYAVRSRGGIGEHAMADGSRGNSLGAEVGAEEVEAAELARQVLLRGDERVELLRHGGFLVVQLLQGGMELSHRCGGKHVAWRFDMEMAVCDNHAVVPTWTEGAWEGQ
jgi:hypothetical protein